MTVRLSASSPRAIHAERFSSELRKAMKTRKASNKRLAEASGCTTASINNWKAGGNLPRTDTATKLAAVLDWPKLVEIAREGRTKACKRCARPFVNEGSGNAYYCSTGCREIDLQLRKPSAGAELARSLRDELERRAHVRGAFPRRFVEDALDRYHRNESRRVVRVDKAAAEVASVRAAVDAMCAACEPDGLCRTDDCPLRTYSPFPLDTAGGPRTELRPALGAWHPEFRERTLAANRAAQVRRWSAPGARERQSRISREWHAGLEPGELARLVKAGRRRQLEEAAS